MFLGRGDGPRPYDAVKLIHADDLRTLRRFPRCQDFDGISFGEYRSQARQLKTRRRGVSRLLDAERELAELDGDQVVTYEQKYVEVPRSLLPRTMRLPLPMPPRPDTWVETDDGAVGAGFVAAAAGWREKWVRLAYRGRSRDVHAERIAELRQLLDAMDDEQRKTMDEVRASRFAQPVLFISHRWETETHPDPTGEQLERLRALEDCFLIYDYTSFPQRPRTEPEQADFERILGAMDELVRDVVVLSAPDYLTRGWCLYEYIVASLRGSTVCDEIADGRMRTLRDWANTPPPVTLAFRDSFESQQQNFINQRILRSINEVLPLYDAADFQTQEDREVVTALLTAHLKRSLPPAKEHQEYLGEWRTVPWTDETLAPFFRGEAEVPRMLTLGIAPFDTDVPATLGEAVARGYEVRRYDWEQLLNPTDSLARFRFSG